MVMNRWLFGVMSLAVSSMAALGQAAAQDSGPKASTLDLTVPMQAGQWTGLAVRNAPLESALAASSPTRPADAGARTRSQPYGTGYEARMSPGAAMGSSGRAAGSPPAPAPRGRGR